MALLVAKFKILFYGFLISLIKTKKRKFKENIFIQFWNKTQGVAVQNFDSY